MKRTPRFFAIAIALLTCLSAHADGFSIPDGETFFVLPEDQIFFAGPVKVDGTFHNDGEVVSTSIFTNNSVVRNNNLFENHGDFLNFRSFDNSGAFTSDGLVINEIGGSFRGTGTTWVRAGRFENYSVVELADLDVTGRFDNHGELTTNQNAASGGNGIHQINGVLDNHAQWVNSGTVGIGDGFTSETEVGNAGLLFNGGDIALAAGARLINTDEIDNRGVLRIGGALINDGLIHNSGELIVDNPSHPGTPSVSGSGEILNDGDMEIGLNSAVVTGRWTNRQTMDFRSDSLVVEGELVNQASMTVSTQSVEIAQGGRLRQAGNTASFAGALINRGVIEAQFGALEADSVENHADLTVSGQLSANSFVQHSGRTQVEGNLATPAIDIFGGEFFGNNGQITGLVSSQDVDVSVWGGTISGGFQGLDIDGNLRLYDDARWFATVVDDDATSIHPVHELVLGGTLEIEFADGLLVTPGDFWVLATATSIDGFFSEIIVPQITGINFDVYVSDSFGHRLVLEAMRAVPIPAPAILLFGACAVLARLRRIQAPTA